MKVLLTFWRTPAWANGGKSPYVPPTDPADFGQAARYTANYFKGRVDAYEVWNEPNLKGGGFWSGTIADYARLLKASYDDFHAGDPNAKVVAGSVVYNDDAWLKTMYDAGCRRPLRRHLDAPVSGHRGRGSRGTGQRNQVAHVARPRRPPSHEGQRRRRQADLVHRVRLVEPRELQRPR